MADRSDGKAGWVARKREQRRLKKERTGDSPEKAAGHKPKQSFTDKMMKFRG